MAGIPSIFNDVLGPIMRGPSSSHTAGAYRIARVARALLGEELASFQCTFDPDGSYAPTYKPLGVDLAFCAGVLGWEMTDPRYESAVTAAAAAGIEVRFVIEPLPHADHPNFVRIDMVGIGGNALTVCARSPGGGTIVVSEAAGRPVHIDGRSWDILLIHPTELAGDVRSLCQAAITDGFERACTTDDNSTLSHWQSLIGVDESEIRGLAGARVFISPPVFYPQVGSASFESASEILDLAAVDGRSLGELAIEYEAGLLGLPEPDVIAEMTRRYAVMKQSVESGLDPGNVRMPLTEPSAANVLAAEKSGILPLGGPHTRAAARAMAVMHVCNSRGVVCAAPTGGSAGVLPGALTVLEEELKADQETIVRAMFAASAVGLIVAKRATFAAETAGCQVEIGVAGAMAAAAVVEAVGGAVKQAADAAAIALQNTMGSVCDPVGGGCEIPCHTRNAVAAANAFICADLIMGGYRNHIPLDESIDASMAVGTALPAELRCTARGGIAITPSAKRLCELHCQVSTG